MASMRLFVHAPVLAMLVGMMLVGMAGSSCSDLMAAGKVSLVGFNGRVAVTLPQCLSGRTGPFAGIDRQHCIGDSLVDLIKATLPQAPGAAVCAAHAISAAGVLPSCHYVAHAIGTAVWDRARSLRPPITSTQVLVDVTADSVRSCPYKLCQYGCIHRVMVHMVDQALRLYRGGGGMQPLAAYIRPIFSEVCRRVRDNVACSHGIGHGLAVLAHGRTHIMVDFGNASNLVTLCSTTVRKRSCVAGVLHGYTGGAIEAIGGEHLAKNTSQVIEMACGFAATEHQKVGCAYWAGFSMPEASCGDLSLSMLACKRRGADSMLNRIKQCGIGARKYFSELATPRSPSKIDVQGLMQCLRNMRPPGPQPLQLPMLFRVVACGTYGDRVVNRGCCGDGSCAWLETSTNCPSDCDLASRHRDIGTPEPPNP